MSTFKCKICGGDLEIIEGDTTAKCEYCGNQVSIDNGKHETIHRIVDEAKLKELDNLQKHEEVERSQTEKKEKSVFKAKMILLAIWAIIVIVLLVLSASTKDSAGYSPYQLLLIPVIIFGVSIIVKEIKKFFENN